MVKIFDIIKKYIISVEKIYDYNIVERGVTDTIVGTTGAAGDVLKRVIVQTVPTVAPLVISDAGTGLNVTIPTTANIGDVYEVGAMCLTSWQVDLDATGLGTVACIGEFT